MNVEAEPGFKSSKDFLERKFVATCTFNAVFLYTFSISFPERAQYEIRALGPRLTLFIKFAELRTRRWRQQPCSIH